MNRSEPAEWARMLREQAALYHEAAQQPHEVGPLHSRCHGCWCFSQAWKFRQAAAILDGGTAEAGTAEEGKP